MNIWPFPKRPILNLGRTGPSWFPWPLCLGPKEISTHKHVLGVSGTGKSKFLESIFLQLFQQRIGVTFIDPHSDSVGAILATLVSSGFFDKNPDALNRLLYIEFRDDEDGWFLPLNILKQPGTQGHVLASGIKEAFHRAWPSLSGGAAPMFDTLVQDASKVLISNGLPITALYRLLSDKRYRDELLKNENDMDIVDSFHNQFDRLRQGDQSDQAGAALRRARLLTFNPALRYSLGQSENVLDFKRILDSGTSVLVNLGTVQDYEARRLLGCLLTIGYEQAALSREGSNRPRREHHLILDEMGEFVAQSEQSFSRMLSQARKYGLFGVFAHQTWSQTSAKLKGALQNAHVEIAFGIGREDAEHVARALGVVDLQAVKSEAKTEASQPVFLQVQEQWETWIQHLTDLPTRHALVKIRGKPARQIVTPNVPRPNAGLQAIERVKAMYRTRLMKKKDRISLAHHLCETVPPSITRTVFTSALPKDFSLKGAFKFG